MTQYIQLVADTIAALGALSTVLSHMPFLPVKAQEFFARFALTSTRFAVVKKDQS